MTTFGSKASISGPKVNLYDQPGMVYDQGALIYDQPGETYDQPGAVYDQGKPTYDGYYGVSYTLRPVQVKARIGKRTAEPLSAKATLRRKRKLFNQSQARLSQPGLRLLGARGRLVRLEAVSVKGSVLNTVLWPLSVHMSILNTAHRSFQMQAQIVHSARLAAKANVIAGVLTKTSALARVKKKETSALGAGARIGSYRQDVGVKASISHDLGIRARMSQQQGWPIPQPSFFSNNNINIFQPTQLRFKARVVPPSEATQGMIVRAKIRWVRGKAFTAKAHLSTGQGVAVQARIKPLFTQTVLPVTYIVNATEQKTLSVIFYTEGAILAPQLSVGAKIIAKKRKVFTGHFLVSGDPQPTGQASSVQPLRAVGAKARIG